MSENTNVSGTSKIKYILWIGAIVPPTLVILLGLVIFNQFLATKNIGESVDSINEVIIGARKVEKLMVDLETGQRGFIITGQEKFLEPFHAANDNIIDEINSLSGKVNSSPTQVALLQVVEQKVEGWIKTAGNPEIEARRKYDRGEINFDTVSHMLVIETGKQQVDAIRAALKQFIAVEHSYSNDRKQEGAVAIGNALFILIVGVALIVILSAATSRFTSKIILNQDWIKSTQADILDCVQGETNLTTFSSSFLSALAPAVSAQTATLYSFHDESFNRIGSYGGIALEREAKAFNEGQGLISQCFSSGQEIHVRDIPEAYFDIGSSLGQAKPNRVILLPVKFNNSVNAVIELASFSEFNKNEISLLRALTDSIGVMIHNVLASMKAASLLEEIKSSEERNLGIVNGSVDAIITINSRGLIESFNLAGEKLFGYRAHEVIGQNVNMLMPEPYHGEHDGYLKNYRETGDKRIIGIGREVEAMKKDGVVFPIDLSVSEITLSDEKLYSGIIRDITERKLAETDLQQANAELEEFAYRTSHDLRSPVVSSIRLLRLTKQALEQQDFETVHQSIGYAHDSLKKMDNLINDILVLTRAKYRDEEITNINISSAVDDALKKMKHMEGFDSLDIQKNFHFDDDLWVKKSRVIMVVENMISNAIKYSDPEKEQSYIKISTYNENDTFTLEVKDNGLGVPEGYQNKLFTMFTRLHPNISFGSGLGLYLMKKSADILGGTVSFEKHADGSIFQLSIPIFNEAVNRIAESEN